MSTLSPPVQLEHPENQDMVDYIQDVASSNIHITSTSYETFANLFNFIQTFHY